MRQLFVDSRDRVSGTSCNFTIQLPQTLVLDGSHRGRIDNLRIPLVIPTIQTGVNDTLTVKLGNQSYTDDPTSELRWPRPRGHHSERARVRGARGLDCELQHRHHRDEHSMQQCLHDHWWNLWGVPAESRFHKDVEQIRV